MASAFDEYRRGGGTLKRADYAKRKMQYELENGKAFAWSKNNGKDISDAPNWNAVLNLKRELKL